MLPENTRKPKVKDTLKIFNNFNNKQQVYEVCFWCVKVCIFWRCIQYTIYWDKTQMLNKFLSGKTIQKTSSFFFREIQLNTVFLLICGSYMSWITRFVSLKLCLGFPIFDSVSFLLKFIFLINKMHSLILQHHNFFQK